MVVKAGKRGFRMKKKICILLAAFVAVMGLSGCRKTPEDPLIVGKNMGNLLEKAQGTEHSENDDLSLKEKTQVSLEELALEETDENVTISVHAAIRVPDGNEMSIIRVKPGDFTQDQITALWNELIGQNEMLKERNQLTRAEIENEILFHQERISKAESEEEKSYHEDQLAYYIDLYNTAPESIVPEPAYGNLESFDDGSGTACTGIRAVSADGRIRFSAENSYQGKDGIRHDATFYFSRSYGNRTELIDGQPETETIEVSMDDKTVPKEALGLRLTPIEAAEQINAFFEAVNLPFAAAEMTLKHDKSNDTWWYSAFCTRLTGVIPSAFILGESYYEQQDGSNSYWEAWNYETVTVSVDDSGIRSVSWEYPIKIIEKVVDNSSLMPFPDILNIFKKMMFVTYGFQARDMDALILDVTDIRLENVRVIEQNADDRQGLLVPAWNFYGTRIRQSGENHDTTSKMILLSVNAVDGTIIDISRGY